MAEDVARAKGIRCFIGPDLGGWIGIYPQHQGQDPSVGEAIAGQLEAMVLHVLVHDDDVMAYRLWRDGQLADSYISPPGYFGEEHRQEEEAMVTQAAANDGQQTEQLLKALVIHPPPPDTPVAQPDPRDLPTARADGAYGNGPTRQRAIAAGFRMEAPSRGQAKQAGVGQVRNAVERGHVFFAQFGRVVRRLDRCARRYLGWIELAARVIFIRAGFVL